MNPVDEGAPPLVTAIIPTFRRPRLLRRAMISTLEQQGAPLQVCVYDNASGDETAAVVASIAAKDSRLRYHCNATNMGSLANFDFGMSRVDTPFFSLLSDDDYLLPGFYQRALAGLTAHPKAMCWAGMTLNVDEKGTIWYARVHDWPRAGLFEPPDGFMKMTGGMVPVWTGILFRREVLDVVGMLDRSILGPADIEYCLRLAARFPYVLEKHPSAVFTLNPESFSATQPMSSFWPGWKRMLQKFEVDGELDAAFKSEATVALRHDAERMLFRRGANALAAGRMSFVRDAARALQDDCQASARARLLRWIAGACESAALMQTTYTYAYRLAERRMVNSRRALQAEYGYLLRAA